MSQDNTNGQQHQHLTTQISNQSTVESDRFLPNSCINALIKSFCKDASARQKQSKSKSGKRKKKETKERLNESEDVSDLSEKRVKITGTRVSKEARELLPILANEFIHHVTSHASQICENDNKRTVNSDHVIAAIERTGFTNYIPECQKTADEAQATAAKRRSRSTKLENSSKSMDELAAEQERLFEEARLAMIREQEEEWMRQQQALQAQQQQNATGQTQAPQSSLLQNSEFADNDDYD